MTEYGNDYVIHHPLKQKRTDESVEAADIPGSFVRSEIKRLKTEIADRQNELQRLENSLIFGSRGTDGEYGKGIAEVNEYGRVQLTELAARHAFTEQQAANFAGWIQAAIK